MVVKRASSVSFRSRGSVLRWSYIGYSTVGTVLLEDTFENQARRGTSSGGKKRKGVFSSVAQPKKRGNQWF